MIASPKVRSSCSRVASGLVTFARAPTRAIEEIRAPAFASAGLDQIGWVIEKVRTFSGEGSNSRLQNPRSEALA